MRGEEKRENDRARQEWFLSSARSQDKVCWEDCKVGREFGEWLRGSSDHHPKVEFLSWEQKRQRMPGANLFLLCCAMRIREFPLGLWLNI